MGGGDGSGGMGVGDGRGVGGRGGEGGQGGREDASLCTIQPIPQQLSTVN